VVAVRITRSIQINPDSVDLAYMDDADVRLGGAVFQTHHISIQRDSDYGDGLEALEAAAEALLTDVLEDYVTSPAYAIPQFSSTDDDDDVEDECWSDVEPGG